jgi:hypothetical protein
MSSELKSILSIVANENDKQERVKFEERIDQYNALLTRIAVEKKLDVTTSVEGIQHPTNMADDLKVLEKARLVSGQTKYTHRNTYREYVLTAKGSDLADKLTKEKLSK